MIKVKSDVTGIKYDPAEVVWLTKIHQIMFYMNQDAQIVDININKKNRIAFGFWVKDHIRLIEQWVRIQEESNDNR